MNKNATVHRACGGGVVYDGPEPADGRPRFRCTKCGEVWSCGVTGGIWAELVPGKVASTRRLS